jgi:hypothetical protein
MICALPLEKIRCDLPELIMDGFEQSLASLLIAVAPARKPSRDLLRVCHTSLNVARK